MFTDQRKDERIIDVGRVEAPELCVFPGILEDISMFGSKIRFPAPVDVELNMDVDLTISPSGNTSQPLKIIAQPKWVKKEGNSTEIGFKFLRSPGTRLLNAYIEKLALANAEFEEEEELLCSGM